MLAQTAVSSPILANLNDQQKAALLGSLTKNSIVLASPGSGKTSLLTKRIEYIIDVKKVDASAIVAFTFTNKAANVLKERISKLTDNYGNMWIGTYHSICVKILRMFGETIGLDQFTILDTKDSRKVAAEIMMKLNLVFTKELLDQYMNTMSKLKNKMISPKMHREAMLDEIRNSTDEELAFVEFYAMYQKENRKNQTLDFDDLIFYSIFILENIPASREFVKIRFKYIHADEVQDSNLCNIKLLFLLSRDCNLFIIGDEDQSIYGFRGANPDLLKLLRFKVFKLERNYRSTQNIVNAANGVITNNPNRADKTCFSLKDIGETIRIVKNENCKDESRYIALKCKQLVEQMNYKYKDIYVLFRTNDQHLMIERQLVEHRVPYKKTRGVSFMQRKEIQDCLSIMKIIINNKDKHSFARALRTMDGIGDKAIDNMIQELEIKGDIRKVIKEFKPPNKTIANSLQKLYNMVNVISDKPYDVLKPIVNHITSGLGECNEEDESLNRRFDSLNFLLQIANEAEGKQDLVDFVLSFDLLMPSDDIDDEDKITLMTVHSSKGLENKVVFVVGCCEGLMPHVRSNSKEGIQEERRLFYVAMTRAEELLYITYYTRDLKSGRRMMLSRYVGEIPTNLTRRI